VCKPYGAASFQRGRGAVCSRWRGTGVSDVARGDHIWVWRCGYTHHGIDCGDGTVIHYAGGLLEKRNIAVRCTTLGEFSGGVQVHVEQYRVCYPPEVVVRRAEGRLGEDRYNLFSNNCEHLARWCKTGNSHSEQIKDRLTALGGALGTGGGLATGL